MILTLTTPLGAFLAILACLLGLVLLFRPDNVDCQRALVAVCCILVVAGLTVGL
jgi:hypothetical protein